MVMKISEDNCSWHTSLLRDSNASSPNYTTSQYYAMQLRNPSQAVCVVCVHNGSSDDSIGNKGHNGNLIAPGNEAKSGKCRGGKSKVCC